ncbi:MAG TPA: sulfite exporter TauE/SafE family protein [Pyrinomonadaceae bacterium]|nr:sulfite exporter TauE/SafE family protein [Pyrinomonadaceae bacterium]
MAQSNSISTRYGSAFGIGAIVGVLGGLIGLGGAEFRLPLLVGWFRYPLLPAILINLLVSLVTVVVSLGFRLQSQGLAPLLEQWPVALNILAGSLPGSYAGVYLATRISERTLVVTVAVVLTLLGLVLIGHDWLFAREPLLLAPTLRLTLGFLAGLLIGAVSSLLGVAGGELIIPTLALFFALDIKLAGSVSLMISIPTIIVGILRYQSRPVFREMKPERHFLIFMSLGSVVGAWIGSQLLPHAPSSLLQIFLGVILVFSAAKMARTRLYGRRHPAD